MAEDIGCNKTSLTLSTVFHMIEVYFNPNSTGFLFPFVLFFDPL